MIGSTERMDWRKVRPANGDLSGVPEPDGEWCIFKDYTVGREFPGKNRRGHFGSLTTSSEGSVAAAVSRTRSLRTVPRHFEGIVFRRRDRGFPLFSQTSPVPFPA